MTSFEAPLYRSTVWFLYAVYGALAATMVLAFLGVLT